jgi:sugar O-acyltransferase (sialic acid O-acetyltransferase NeuD family)
VSVAGDPRETSRFVGSPPAPVPLIDTGGVVVLGAGRSAIGGRLPIVVYGGGGHGAQCIDLLRGLDGPEANCVLDDGLPAGTGVNGVEVVGGAAELANVRERGVAMAVNGVGGITAPGTRARVFDLLIDAGFTLPAVIHASAWPEPSAWIAPGAQVFALAYLGSRAVIGAGALVNAGAVVSHDCVLGACANLSPGALLAGEVEIGPSAIVGMGATINVGVRVGANALVGNGATVKADVPAGTRVRAGHIWE